jgi:hypothetical protein
MPDADSHSTKETAAPPRACGGVNLLAVLIEWRLGVHAGQGRAIAAFQECFWVVTIAFAAAIIPALAIRQHTPGTTTQRS